MTDHTNLLPLEKAPFSKVARSLRAVMCPQEIPENGVVVFKDVLTGDFDAAAKRIACQLSKRQNIPVEQRAGMEAFDVFAIKTNWGLLKARYTPFGSMSKQERQAFDTIIADLSRFQSISSAGDARLRVVYEAKPRPGLLGENEFHIDYAYRGAAHRVLRPYNHKGMLCVDLKDTFSQVNSRGDDLIFSPKDGSSVYQAEIGDYTVHRFSPYIIEDEFKGGFVHKAPVKDRGETPRLVMVYDA